LGILTAVLGGVFLWRLAEHAGPPGEVVVHVIPPGVVDVALDGRVTRVDSRDSPVVAHLRLGRHTLRMSRDGKLLYEEVFWVRPGSSTILAAWDAAPRTTAPAAP
jgi:hypothetical protein